MSEDERPETGDLRFTGTGDVEVFDGEQWRPIASLMGEAGMRGDPARPGDAAAAEDGSTGP